MKKVKKCNEKIEVFSRVAGFYRPTKLWNRGKSEEFKSRKTFFMEKNLDLKKEKALK